LPWCIRPSVSCLSRRGAARRFGDESPPVAPSGDSAAPQVDRLSQGASGWSGFRPFVRSAPSSARLAEIQGDA
jgi:hypothetical protein